MDGKACASVALQRTRRENLFPPLQKCMLDACATRWWQRRGRPPAAQLRICLLRICLLLLWFPYNSLDFFHCTHGKDQNKRGALPRRAQEETSATPALVCQPQSQGREDSSQSMARIVNISEDTIMSISSLDPHLSPSAHARQRDKPAMCKHWITSRSVNHALETLLDLQTGSI